MEEQKRHSGFETMRILSMVMIVLMHGIGHGGLAVRHRRVGGILDLLAAVYSGACIHKLFCNAFRLLSVGAQGAVRAGRLFRIGAQV